MCRRAQPKEEVCVGITHQHSFTFGDSPQSTCALATDRDLVATTFGLLAQAKQHFTFSPFFFSSISFCFVFFFHYLQERGGETTNHREGEGWKNQPQKRKRETPTTGREGRTTHHREGRRTH